MNMTANEVELVAPQTLKLIKSAQAGDPEALAQAVNQNMELVHKALHETGASGNDDLQQEAVIGLMDAIEGYDLKSHWLSYSLLHIKGTIGRARQRNRLMPLPVGGTGQTPGIAKALRLAREELSVNGNEPTTKAVADAVGIDEELAMRLEASDSAYSQLDDVVIAREDPGYEHVEAADECSLYLDGLRPLEREIVSRFFGVDGYEPQSMTAIARDLDIGYSTASSLKARALKKMRKVAA